MKRGPDLSNPSEAKFEHYWAKMLTRYAGITEAEYERLAKRKKEDAACADRGS